MFIESRLASVEVQSGREVVCARLLPNTLTSLLSLASKDQNEQRYAYQTILLLCHVDTG